MYFVLAIFGDTSELTYIGPSRCIILDRFGLPYIGMGIEISIPMYRLLKLGPPYIGMALKQASPMYIPKTIHSRYIGMSLKHQIPMYPKKEYIGTPQKLAIPMYLPPLQVYQIKQPALPLTSNFRRISAQIIVRLTRARICCEGKQVYSREINWNTSELSTNLRIERCFTTNHMRLELQKYQKSS